MMEQPTYKPLLQKYFILDATHRKFPIFSLHTNMQAHKHVHIRPCMHTVNTHTSVHTHALSLSLTHTHTHIHARTFSLSLPPPPAPSPCVAHFALHPRPPDTERPVSSYWQAAMSGKAGRGQGIGPCCETAHVKLFWSSL